MNKIKMIYSTLLALAVVITSAGCKTEHHSMRAGDTWPAQSTSQPSPAATFSPGTSAVSEPAKQQIPIPTNWTPELTNQDSNGQTIDTIHFDFGSSVIRASEQVKLQSVTSALQLDKEANLLIKGNCDERGTGEYNRVLGEHRALAAREALAGMGIDPIRIRTISYGKDKPVDPGHNEAAWWQNRRDDFVLLNPKTGE
jgi:peptidoglycan-associated lipoprotein